MAWKAWSVSRRSAQTTLRRQKPHSPSQSRSAGPLIEPPRLPPATGSCPVPGPEHDEFGEGRLTASRPGASSLWRWSVAAWSRSAGTPPATERVDAIDLVPETCHGEIRDEPDLNGVARNLNREDVGLVAV